MKSKTPGVSAKGKYVEGDTYGKLTLLKLLDSDRFSNRLGLFLCSCGTEKVLPCFQAKRGGILSCGCANKITAKANLKKWSDARVVVPGLAAFNALYGSYARDARKRDLPFELTQEEFRDLTRGNCHYCGIIPSQVTTRGKHEITPSRYLYNGVDRVDSDKGYSSSNCVSCCCTCNRMKGAMPLSKFVSHVATVARRMGAVGSE